MTSPNPMALEAKALEAAKLERLLRKWAVTVENETLDGRLPGNEAVNELWLVALDAADFLDSFPFPAAGEGLEPVAADLCYLVAVPNDERLPLHLAGPGSRSVMQSVKQGWVEQMGHGWEVELWSVSRATPAARAAVLEEAIDALIAELDDWRTFQFGGTAQFQSGVHTMKEKMIARLTERRRGRLAQSSRLGER